MLASIGVPLFLKALTDNGMQSYSRYQPPPSPLPPEISVEDRCGMQVRTYDESLVPYRSPPFVGSWP